MLRELRAKLAAAALAGLAARAARDQSTGIQKASKAALYGLAYGASSQKALKIASKTGRLSWMTVLRLTLSGFAHRSMPSRSLLQSFSDTLLKN